MFNLFKVDINKYPTLSSLAFAIFRSNFMEKENIPQLFYYNFYNELYLFLLNFKFILKLSIKIF
jgi:hypothetical protein